MSLVKGWRVSSDLLRRFYLRNVYYYIDVCVVITFVSMYKQIDCREILFIELTCECGLYENTLK